MTKKNLEGRMKAAESHISCPMIKRPLKDSFCSYLSSRNIKSAMYFCGGHYEECKVFKNQALGSSFQQAFVKDASMEDRR